MKTKLISVKYNKQHTQTIKIMANLMIKIFEQTMGNHLSSFDIECLMEDMDKMSEIEVCLM
jgi:hypothetical protein